MDEYTKQLIEDARATYHDVVAGRDSRAANPRGLAPLEVEQEPRACALWLFRRARHGGSRRNAALARTRTIERRGAYVSNHHLIENCTRLFYGD